MFLSTKKLRKFPPPFIFFITFAPRKCELSCKRLIYIIIYLYDIDETKNKNKLNSLIDGETIDFSYSVTLICIAS